MSDSGHAPAPGGAGSSLRPGSIEQTLAGQADLPVGQVIREAWALTDGIKAPIVAGVLLVYAGLSLAVLLLGSIFASEEPDPLGNAISQLVIMVIVHPFMGGALLFGLRRSLGEPVRFDMLFSQYPRALPIVAVALLQSVLTGIGFVLLIVPGLYLSIALSLAVPLKVERDLPLLECLTTSIRLVNRKFLEVALLMLAAIGLMVLGVLSLIGWIWTLPWTFMIFALIYRQLAGLATPGAGPVARVTAEY